ncbi:MAG: hypothetical protein A2190_05915 [Lysobacterales bacterium RIFOXYA1_FULL_69_10]|nr:MAG: hypothetical protein A2190_05915 [Xanthomonadales bacterium RIFOXYA1_FULL_69_10]
MHQTPSKYPIRIPQLRGAIGLHVHASWSSHCLRALNSAFGTTCAMTRCWSVPIVQHAAASALSI